MCKISYEEKNEHYFLIKIILIIIIVRINQYKKIGEFKFGRKCFEVKWQPYISVNCIKKKQFINIVRRFGFDDRTT